MTCKSLEASGRPVPTSSQQTLQHESDKGSRRWYERGDAKLLYEFLPYDNSLQSYSLRQALEFLDQMFHDHNPVNIVDLGCGRGETFDTFSKKTKRTRWLGFDIGDSPEATAQERKPPGFCTYDGLRLPLADNSVHMVYSRQVLEHVRHPEPVLAEIRRVLKSGGVLVGSTSHMEPLHSRSFWNYTPYGFCVLLRDAGFQSIEVRPGIDALTLVTRRLFDLVRLSTLFAPFFTFESPTNLLLELGLRLLGQPVKRRNYFKLVFSGHFCFSARK